MRIFVSRLALAALAVSVLAPLSVAAVTDSTPPAVSSPVPTSTYKNQSTTYSANYTDDIAGVAQCVLVVNSVDQGTMTLSNPGGLSGTATRAYTYTGTAGSISVRVRCTDQAASPNTGTSATVTVTIFTDNTAPSVSNLQPATATVGVATTISAFATDDEFGSGINTCGVIVDGVESGLMTASGSTYSLSGVTFSSAGSHTVQVNCLDRTGNLGTASRTVTVAAADSTAPVVSNLQPTSATKDVAVTISVTATDNVAINKCFSTIDGVVTAASMSQSGTTYSESHTFTTVGSHSISVSCNDTASPANSTAVSGTISVTTAPAADSTLPTVTGVGPTTATSGSAVSITASVADNVGISSCTLSVGGVSQGAMAVSSGVASRSHTFAAAGSFAVEVRCTDAAGNTGTGSATVTVSAPPATADSTVPSVGQIAQTAATAGTAITLTATASDNIGISSCTLYVSGGAAGTMAVSGGSALRSYTFSAAGSYAAEVRCTDAAGNTGVGLGRTITVSAPAADTNPPTIGTVTPTTATAGIATTLSVSVSDPSGLGSCTLFVNGVSQGAMTLSGGVASRSHTFASAGSYTVRANCSDARTNLGEGPSQTVTVSVPGATPTPVPISTGADPDADGDDLADADETLYGTSPTTRDTDGDGFSDGTEVRNGYNPLGAGLLSAPTTSAVPGRLLKLACPAGADAFHACKAVYYYGRDGKRHAFPSARIYFTWFNDFAQVQVVDAAFLASLPVGKNVLPRPGVRLVKFPTVNTVYAVDRGGVLRAVTSESVASGVYGSAWNTKIDDVDDTLFGNFLFGVDITSAAAFSPSSITAATTSIDGNF